MLEFEHARISRFIEVDGRQVDPVLDDAETGLWGTGTGWEMGLIALEKYLRGEMPDDAAASHVPAPEVMALAARGGEAWAAAVAGGDRA